MADDFLPDVMDFRFLHKIRHGEERTHVEKLLESFKAMFQGLYTDDCYHWTREDLCEFAYALVVRELRSERGKDALRAIGVTVPTIPIFMDLPETIAIAGSVHLIYHDQVDIKVGHPVLPTVVDFVVRPFVKRFTQRAIIREARKQGIELSLIR